jgi:hypothetical protein
MPTVSTLAVSAAWRGARASQHTSVGGKECALLRLQRRSESSRANEVQRTDVELAEILRRGAQAERLHLALQHDAADAQGLGRVRDVTWIA